MDQLLLSSAFKPTWPSSEKLQSQNILDSENEEDIEMSAEENEED